MLTILNNNWFTASERTFFRRAHLRCMRDIWGSGYWHRSLYYANGEAIIITRGAYVRASGHAILRQAGVKHG